MKMKLPKDIIEKISNELTIKEFVNFCEALPQSNEVWKRRFQKDFPFLYTYITSNYSKYYLQIIDKTNSSIENIINAFIDKFNSNFRKYLKMYAYESDLNVFLFEELMLCIESLASSEDVNHLFDISWECFYVTNSNFFACFYPTKTSTEDEVDLFHDHLSAYLKEIIVMFNIEKFKDYE